MTNALESRFQRLFDPPADAVYSALEASYGEPHRRYHTLAHIADCLEQMDSAPPTGAERVIELALWWHDVIYDPTAADNEGVSAERAAEDLSQLGSSPAEIAEVARLIRLTAGHKVPAGALVDARLVSVDLSILGRPSADYDRYVSQVRAEYAHVPEVAWRMGRPRVMTAFLDGPIYADPWFEGRLGAQARSNIEREIASLRSS